MVIFLHIVDVLIGYGSVLDQFLFVVQEVLIVPFRGVVLGLTLVTTVGWTVTGGPPVGVVMTGLMEGEAHTKR